MLATFVHTARDDVLESTAPHNVHPYEMRPENRTVYACVFSRHETTEFSPQGISCARCTPLDLAPGPSLHLPIPYWPCLIVRFMARWLPEIARQAFKVNFGSFTPFSHHVSLHPQPWPAAAEDRAAPETQDMMRVPARVINHRQLTCLLPAWRFAAQRVVFRVFRGCCRRQHQEEEARRRARQEQRQAAAAAAEVGVGAFDKSETTSYWVNDLGVHERESGGPHAGSRRLLDETATVEEVPGDARYIWEELQLTIKGVDTSGGIPFDWLQGWLSLAPSCAVIGDGTPVQIYGYGFNSTAQYVCVFSGTGHGNISTYSDELQVPAGVPIYCCYYYCHCYCYCFDLGKSFTVTGNSTAAYWEKSGFKVRV